MIDAIWLLGSRALIDYAKAATTWFENKPRTTAHKFGYAITGLVLTVVVCPLFVFGAYTILTSLMHL